MPSAVIGLIRQHRKHNNYRKHAVAHTTESQFALILQVELAMKVPGHMPQYRECTPCCMVAMYVHAWTVLPAICNMFQHTGNKALCTPSKVRPYITFSSANIVCDSPTTWLPSLRVLVHDLGQFSMKLQEARRNHQDEVTPNPN